MQDTIIQIRNYVHNWQLEYDKNYSILPIDEHAKLIFHNGREIITFDFSDKYLMGECRLSIPLDLLKDFPYMIDQEDGFTYYSFNLNDEEN